VVTRIGGRRVPGSQTHTPILRGLTSPGVIFQKKIGWLNKTESASSDSGGLVVVEVLVVIVVIVVDWWWKC